MVTLSGQHRGFAFYLRLSRTKGHNQRPSGAEHWAGDAAQDGDQLYLVII
jgi:hypothetical protein